MGLKMVGLADIVRTHAAERPQAAALVHEGRTTTYGELDRAAAAYAGAGPIAEIGSASHPARTDSGKPTSFRVTSRPGCC